MNQQRPGMVCLSRQFLEDKSLIADPRSATNVARVVNRVEADRLVGAAFAHRSAPEAIAARTKADVAFALVNDMEGLSTHPHLRRVTLDTPNDPESYPAPPAIFDGTPRDLGGVPQLGDAT